MKELTSGIKSEIRELVYDYLADECEVDKDDINDGMSVISDLDGDSLMFVELVETLKKRYGLSIQMQSIGKYLLKDAAETVGEVINTCYLVYEKENAIVDEG